MEPNEQPAAVLVEGRDYTVEAGRWVFTAYFLKSRGYCCESGCRNCPYGDAELSGSEPTASDNRG